MQLWAAIRTHNTLSKPQFVQSVAAIMTYSYNQSEVEGLQASDSLCVETTRLTMPLAPYPSQSTGQNCRSARRYCVAYMVSGCIDSLFTLCLHACVHGSKGQAATVHRAARCCTRSRGTHR